MKHKEIHLTKAEIEYLQAKKIVENYEKKLNDSNLLRSKLLRKKQLERELKCGDHYFVERGKWQNGMICQDCKKIIG